MNKGICFGGPYDGTMLRSLGRSFTLRSGSYEWDEEGKRWVWTAATRD